MTNISIEMEFKMGSARTLFCFLTVVILTATTQVANAVVYCNYVGVPKGCTARAGVVLLPAPGVGVAGVGVGARGVGVGVGGPANRGGPVNRAGRR